MNNILKKVLNTVGVICFLFTVGFIIWFIFFRNPNIQNDVYKNMADSLKVHYEKAMTIKNKQIDSISMVIKIKDSIILSENASIIKLKQNYEKNKNIIINLGVDESIDLFTRNYEARKKSN